MSNFKVIGDIGETLKNILDDNTKWTDITKPEITLKSPKQIKDDGEVNNKVSIFLYQIVENIHLKNEQLQRIDNTNFRHPPMALDLSYLVTPYSIDPTQEKYILGKVMQIFFDNPVLTGTVLTGSLKGTDDEFRLIFNPLSLDDLTKIWGDFQDVDYKLSISYIISPIRIDSKQEMSMKRVVSKEMDYYYSIPKKEGT